MNLQHVNLIFTKFSRCARTQEMQSLIRMLMVITTIQSVRKLDLTNWPGDVDPTLSLLEKISKWNQLQTLNVHWHGPISKEDFEEAQSNLTKYFLSYPNVQYLT